MLRVSSRSPDPRHFNFPSIKRLMQGVRWPSAVTCAGVVLILALCSYPSTNAQRRRGGGGGGEVQAKEKRDYYDGKQRKFSERRSEFRMI